MPVQIEGIQVPAAPTLVGRESRLRPLVYLLSTIAAIGWTFYAGKDLNWDALNYHLYAGFSVFNDRFDLDYFAASIQGYLNPYAYAPLYLMVKANLPSLAIAMIFATLHSVNFWLCYELALVLNRRKNGEVAFVTVLLSVFLAALNPVLLQELGSTFADISTGAFALGGWVALAYAFEGRVAMRVALGGALLGIAAALKLSNAICGIATLPMLAMLPGNAGWRMRMIALFGLAAGLAFLAVAGPWGFRLWKHLGNPLFPLFNALFASPDFTTGLFKHLRFVPSSLGDALIRPFKIILPDPYIHTEPRAPDTRYAALAVLLPVQGLLSACRALFPGLEANTGSGATGQWSSASEIALRAVTIGFVAAWALWLEASGNSRYFLPMSCVAGVLLGTVFGRIFGGSRRARFYVAAGLLSLQITQIYLGAARRWSSLEWDGPWFQVSVPERFRHQPYFYISFTDQSTSFFLPFLAPGSGMMDVVGQWRLDPSGKAAEMLQRNAGRVRLLVASEFVTPDGVPIDQPSELLNANLAGWGLQIDSKDCAMFSVHGGQGSTTFGHLPSRPLTLGQLRSHYRTCRLIPAGSAEVEAYRHEQAMIDVVFNHVEEACPTLFQPSRPISQKRGITWRRLYANTDLDLWIKDGVVKFVDSIHGGDPIVIGRAEDWARAPQALDCKELNAASSKGLWQAH